MARKFEIWATFENGKSVKVEVHKNLRSAQSAVDAMDHKNRIDLACGYGFPCGLPTYSIK